MPPAFESAIVNPLVVAIALTLVVDELTSVLVAAFKGQYTDAELHVVRPVTFISSAGRPFKRSKPVHFVALPGPFVDASFHRLV